MGEKLKNGLFRNLEAYSRWHNNPSTVHETVDDERCADHGSLSQLCISPTTSPRGVVDDKGCADFGSPVTSNSETAARQLMARGAPTMAASRNCASVPRRVPEAWSTIKGAPALAALSPATVRQQRDS